jgi:hypothetical protein
VVSIFNHQYAFYTFRQRAAAHIPANKKTSLLRRFDNGRRLAELDQHVLDAVAGYGSLAAFYGRIC